MFFYTEQILGSSPKINAALVHLLQNLFQNYIFLEQISLQKLVSLDTQREVKTSTENNILFIKTKAGERRTQPFMSLKNKDYYLCCN